MPDGQHRASGRALAKPIIFLGALVMGFAALYPSYGLGSAIPCGAKTGTFATRHPPGSPFP
ncbi:hypothetical protein ABIA96_000368 [Bradyrhizobium sp. LB11.1]